MDSFRFGVGIMAGELHALWSTDYTVGNWFWFGGVLFYLFFSRLLIRSLRAMVKFQSFCPV